MIRRLGGAGTATCQFHRPERSDTFDRFPNCFACVSHATAIDHGRSTPTLNSYIRMTSIPGKGRATLTFVTSKRTGIRGRPALDPGGTALPSVGEDRQSTQDSATHCGVFS